MQRPMVGRLVLLVLGVLLLSLAATAPPAGKMPRIGVLAPGTPAGPWVDAFRQGLRALGYVEDQTIALDIRWDEYHPERSPALAADLVRLRVDLIVVGTAAATRAAQHATSTIPIVMATSGDPVGDGLVASLARPGGNVTGLSSMHPDLTGKRLELLTEAVPGLARVALLMDARHSRQDVMLHDHEAAARGLGVQLLPLAVREPEGFAGAFQAAIEGQAQALIMHASPLFGAHQGRLAELALASHLPTMAADVGYATAGGLMDYGAPQLKNWHRAATYVHKILHGAKPADLPVEQPMNFELVINLKTAKALGLTISPTLLFQADEVIR
jgi:ABC-type uncharacterized transport system substrate-binding protein